jgi:hypothetical protein
MERRKGLSICLMQYTHIGAWMSRVRLEGESLQVIEGELDGLFHVALLGQHAAVSHHLLELTPAELEEQLLLNHARQLHQQLRQLVIQVYPRSLALQ